MSAKTIRCKQCKEMFATRWADDATMSEYGLAGMVSDKFEIGRNFCNKLWNAARFAFLNIEGAPCATLDIESLPTEDRWILARLSETIRQLHEQLSQYRFSASIKLLRDYFWDALCDWYIELTKARMADGPFAAEAKQILAFCLDQTLRMLHPFIPFVTERLWQQLNAVVPARGLVGLAEPAHGALLVTASFPPAEGWPLLENSYIVSLFSVLQEATRGIRDLRNRTGVPPKEQVDATINVSADRVDGLRQQASILQRMAKVGSLHIATDAPRPANSGVLVLGVMQIYVHDVSDDAAERSRLTREMASVDKQIAGKEGKLGNSRFVENAKPEVVAAERERLVALQKRKTLLNESLALLE